MPINKIDMRTNKRANTLGALRSYLGYKNKNEVKIILEKIFKVFIINQIIK
jgi:ABC-type tungstate transport system permease subunit